MAIENVVSYNNVKESNEKSNNVNDNENKSIKLKKDNIIHLLNGKDNKSKNNEKNGKEIINKDHLDNINTNINNNSDEKLNLNNFDNLISEPNENLDNDALKNNANNNNDKNEEIDNDQLMPERDYNIENENKNSNRQNKEKKVHFDEKLVYINYDQDDYITELELTDQNGRILPYKEKDFTKYLRLLTSVSSNSKPQSIVAKSHKKRKKKKKTKIMERNMEFIKQIEKTGNLYGNLKEYEKKPPNSESKNCRKFMENPQQFFTEDLCDVMLLQYDIDPKEHLNSSSTMSLHKKYKDKK